MRRFDAVKIDQDKQTSSDRNNIDMTSPDHLEKTNTDDIYQPWFVDDLEHQLQTKFSSKGIYQHQFQQMIGEFPSMEVEATIKNAFIKKSRNIKEMLSYFP